MNIPILSIKSILSKPLSSFLSWLLMTFGVIIVVLILLISSQLKNEISKNAQGIDLVVGAKGSPLQLILCNIFHVDFPTGNISLQEAAKVSRSRYIERAIPLALGDSYQGFRIVGSTEEYLSLYEAKFSQGNSFDHAMEVVVGSSVAEKLKLNLGDTFESQHGLSEDGEAHGAHPFKVVGILERNFTVIDQLIVTKIESIWEVHGHDEEAHSLEADSLMKIDHLNLAVTSEQFEEEDITSVLIKYRSPMGAVMLPRSINSESALQAASPAYETSRLFNIIGVGVEVLQLLGLVIIIISAISMFIALLHSLNERKTDLAIMRSMGATKVQIFFHILIEGLVISLVGGLSGLALAHILMVVLSDTLGLFSEPFFFLDSEWIVLIGCLFIGLLSAVIPAWMAYRTDISKTLSKG